MNPDHRVVQTYAALLSLYDDLNDLDAVDLEGLKELINGHHHGGKSSEVTDQCAISMQSMITGFVQSRRG